MVWQMSLWGHSDESIAVYLNESMRVSVDAKKVAQWREAAETEIARYQE